MGEVTKLKIGRRISLSTIKTYLKSILMLLRVAHWAKNLFLFVPLFFSGGIFHKDKLLAVTVGVIAFCFISSAVYILNDYRDLKVDRLHPVKRHRPMAAGKISVPIAMLIMIACLVIGFTVAWYCGSKFLLILGAYLVLNILYSFGLKNISILDILIIAAGFILRIKGGGYLAHVGISQWLMIIIFLLSLFLALGKRRDDLLIKQTSGNEMRLAMTGYNADFLNVSLAIIAAILMMAYIMYTLSPDVILHMGTYRLYYTSVFVGAGLLRYLQLIYIKNKTRSPIRVLFKDRFIQICILLWIASFYLLLYFPDWHFLEY